MEKNQNKALWIFPNFKETIDTIPQKYRGRAWEILIEYGFNGEIDLSQENKYIQIVVKSLLPLMRLRGVGGSIGGKSNNPTGKKKANVGANVGVNVGANVGATPYKQEQEQEQEKENKKEVKFIAPNIEEIINYCKERNNNVDAVKFFNYYESVGWMVGKHKMKNWKSAIITWEQNAKKYATKPIKTTTTFNNLPLVGDNWTEEDIRKLRG